MLRVLVVGRPDSPDPHHLLPLLEVLLHRGHDVVLLATVEYRALVDARVDVRLLPAAPVPIPAPGPVHGVRRLRHVFRSLLIEPLEAHWPAVARVVEEERPDVVIADALCFAACMLAERPRDARPPVIVLGTIPPPHAHPHAAPYGLGLHPDPSVVDGLRNAALHLVIRQVVLRPVLAELRSVFRRLSGLDLRLDVYDAAGHAEVWAQCEPERFEYPRAEAGNLRLVGPLAAERAALLPPWWDPADRRGIVLARMSRGVDRGALLRGLIAATDGLPLRLVLAGTTRADAEAALGEALPARVMAMEGRHAAQVLPRTAVVITRGHFVHAQHALQQGTPVIAFGTRAEEAETGARLEWHRCGVRLRTDLPDADVLRRAVETVARDPSYRRAAARFAAQASRMDAEATIADLAEALAGTAAVQADASGG